MTDPVLSATVPEYGGFGRVVVVPYEKSLGPEIVDREPVGKTELFAVTIPVVLATSKLL